MAPPALGWGAFLGVCSFLGCRVLSGVSVVLLVACGGEEARGRTAQVPAPVEGAHAPATAEESVLVAEADSAMRGWLEASRLAGATDTAAVVRDALVRGACDDGFGDAVWPMPVLAAHRLLRSEIRGDTVIARAEVTTVAEQDHDRRRGGAGLPVVERPGGFVVRQRVRVDTLEWDVVPGDAGWHVCNGIRFGVPGTDSLVRWTPEGASLMTARLLVDSVRTAARPAPLP